MMHTVPKNLWSISSMWNTGIYYSIATRELIGSIIQENSSLIWYYYMELSLSCSVTEHDITWTISVGLQKYV